MRKTAAGVAALAFALGLPACGGSDEVPVLPPGRAIETSRTLSPTAHLFADAVRAELEVVVDRRLLDPDRVRVEASFDPYDRVEADLARSDLGSYTRLRYHYALRCLTVDCIPVRIESILGEQEEGRAERRTFRLPAVQIRYDDPTEERPVVLRSVTWPPLTSVSRLNEAQSQAEFPFRLSAAELPSISYRAPPPLLAGGLALLGLLLLALPVRATVGWWRERRPPPAVEPLTELSALERARALVVWSCEHGDGVDRRKALAALSDELDHADIHDGAAAARRLAWSKPVPAPEPALALAQKKEPDRAVA